MAREKANIWLGRVSVPISTVLSHEAKQQIKTELML